MKLCRSIRPESRAAAHRIIPMFLLMPTRVQAWRFTIRTTGRAPRHGRRLGGTSVSAPAWAGLVAIADQGRAATGNATLNGRNQTLPAIYSISAGDFHDITTGSNGGYKAGLGYDEVTGLGSPKANLVVNDLAAYGLAAKLVVSAQPASYTDREHQFGLSVLAEDSSGAALKNFNASITISLENNPGGGALGGTLTVLAKNGVATFSGLTLTLKAAATRLMRPAAVLP